MKGRTNHILHAWYEEIKAESINQERQVPSVTANKLNSRKDLNHKTESHFFDIHGYGLEETKTDF